MSNFDDFFTASDVTQGTWSPVLSSTGDDMVMAAGTGGKYVRVGNLVMVSFEMLVSSFGSVGAGAVLLISGLPFSVAPTADENGGGAVCEADDLVISANSNVNIIALATGTRMEIDIWEATSGTQNFNRNNILVTGDMAGFGVYITDA